MFEIGGTSDMMVLLQRHEIESQVCRDLRGQVAEKELNLYWNIKYIGVRSFILAGAPWFADTTDNGENTDWDQRTWQREGL